MRSVNPGEGIRAYFTLHKWFTETTGLALSEKMKAVMTPTPPKTEGDIADSIDKWLETMRSLEEMKDEYKLSDPFKITALKIMMVGRAREHFEQIELKEGADYSKVLSQCKEYATRRRLEANMKRGTGDAMDVGAVEQQ